jgi:CheY-like chemotaxis protein
MIDFRVAVRTTVLLVDDDTAHLELRTRVMEESGFSVVNATSPLEAISIMNADSLGRIDVAVLDYHMPVMNGCILAEYLKDRYPELRIVLYSGALDIPEREMSSIDVFVAKADGIDALLAKITHFGPMDATNSPFFVGENNHWMDAVN